MKINVKIELTKLRRMRPALQILDHIVVEDVITYKSFLDTNLRTNIDHLVHLENDGSVQTIKDISLPFRDLDVRLSIELLNSIYKGSYTLWCPELRGCITQGKTKREAFDNLLFAISEVLIVSYDELGINPLTFPVTPLPLYSHIEFPNTMFGHSIGSSFTRNLFDEYQFEKIYIGERHFILTKGDDSAIGLTFLFDGINDLTKYCFDQVIEKTIRSVK